jgi:hypothetical protein
VVILAVIAAAATGFLNISQKREAQAPTVATTGNGVAAKGGQTPAFQVETGSIRVGSKDATVKLPTVEVARPRNEPEAAASNNAM